MKLLKYASNIKDLSPLSLLRLSSEEDKKEIASYNNLNMLLFYFLYSIDILALVMIENESDSDCVLYFFLLCDWIKVINGLVWVAIFVV